MSAPPKMDPTFYRSPGEAAAAPPERLAYVVAFDRSGEKSDALTVVDVDPGSEQYGQIVGWADLPTRGDELHHFGWNACSSALMHEGHDMGEDGLQRRYLLLPGIRSSNIHVYDTQPDPANPTLVKTITPEELSSKAGYSRPHTLHCGPDGIFLSCLGGADGAEVPGGIALLDHNTFDVLRAWETDRGPQYLAYDAWWHLTQNTLITSEWGTPSMIEDGLIPELLLSGKYGHSLHFWDLAAGKHLQEIDLGPEQQMVLELRPAHAPDASYGFVGRRRQHRGPPVGRAEGDHRPGRPGRPATGVALSAPTTAAPPRTPTTRCMATSADESFLVSALAGLSPPITADCACPARWIHLRVSCA